MVARRTLRASVLVSFVFALALAPLPYAAAEDPPATLDLSGDTSGRIRDHVELTATLTPPGTDPPGFPRVRFERLVDGTWTLIGTVATDAAGVAKASPVLTGSTNDFRGVVVHSEPSVTASWTVAGTKHPTALVIGGSRRIVDESSGVITATWRTDRGEAVAGVARLYSRPQGGTWHLVRSARLGADGIHRFSIRPRVDTRYKLRGSAGSWWLADVSGERRIDNLPGARPWYAPSAAPRPVALPAQRRGFGAGAHVRVTRLPDSIWNHMTGISWRRGCPVGRGSLRLVRTNYWGFDGYRHRGELVVNKAVVHKFVGALRGLHDARLPIRGMYRVDRFGYNRTSGGGDDFASMRADNTSVFNCRWVTGNPGVRSPHSWGRAWDLNPFENPYRSNWGWLPNSWWPSHSDARVAWRSTSHAVVRILRANGFRWTYGNGDSQHFDGREAGLPRFIA